MQNHNRRSTSVKSSPSEGKSSTDIPAKAPWFLRAFTHTILDASVIDLSDRARFVLMVLDARAGTDPFCFPGNKWLREKTGKSDSTLAEIFNELEGKGWFVRSFTEAKKRERVGFIFLRRIDPEISPASEDSTEAIGRATAAMLAKIASLASGNPAPSSALSPEIRRHRHRKSGDSVSGNPATPDSGNPAPYKESVVIVRHSEADSGIQSGGGSDCLPDDNDQRKTPRMGGSPRAAESALPIEPSEVEAVEGIMVFKADVGDDTHPYVHLPAGVVEFLDKIGPTRRTKLRGMSLGMRRLILSKHCDGFDEGCWPVQLLMIDDAKAQKPTAKIETMEEFIRAIPGDAGLLGKFAETLCQKFDGPGDRQRWGAMLAFANQVHRREVEPDVVLDSFRQAMGPNAKNRGAVFTHALKAHGWRP